MAEAPFVTGEARALIDKETSVSVKVSEQDVRRLAIASGDLNPLYLDEASAKRSRYIGIIAHPMHYMVTLMPPRSESELLPNGMPPDWNMPMKYKRNVAGETVLEFFAPVRPGDTITAKRKIADITEKQSSKGGWIAIVTRQATYTNQKGELLLIEKMSAIYS